jgi:hypothetical protein
VNMPDIDERQRAGVADPRVRNRRVHMANEHIPGLGADERGHNGLRVRLSFWPFFFRPAQAPAFRIRTVLWEAAGRSANLSICRTYPPAKAATVQPMPYDPMPYGLLCGCVNGACIWR